MKLALLGDCGCCFEHSYIYETTFTAMQPSPSNCELWEDVADQIRKQLQDVSIISMNCEKNSRCSGLQCTTTINMRVTIILLSELKIEH